MWGTGDQAYSGSGCQHAKLRNTEIPKCLLDHPKGGKRASELNRSWPYSHPSSRSQVTSSCLLERGPGSPWLGRGAASAQPNSMDAHHTHGTHMREHSPGSSHGHQPLSQPLPTYSNSLSSPLPPSRDTPFPAQAPGLPAPSPQLSTGGRAWASFQPSLSKDWSQNHLPHKELGVPKMVSRKQSPLLDARVGAAPEPMVLRLPFHTHLFAQLPIGAGSQRKEGGKRNGMKKLTVGDPIHILWGRGTPEPEVLERPGSGSKRLGRGSKSTHSCHRCPFQESCLLLVLKLHFFLPGSMQTTPQGSDNKN